MAKRQETRSESLRGWIGVILIVVFIRTFLFQPFHIPSDSMEPGIMKGDYIIVTKFSTGYGRHAAWPLPFPAKSDRWLKRGADRGDVIVFRPDGIRKDYIKRIVGLPGDVLSIASGDLYVNQVSATRVVNGTQVSEQTASGRIYTTRDSNPASDLDQYVGPWTLPENMYFVMGDNRDNSLDSRVPAHLGGAGFVPSTAIVGEAQFILLSVKDDFVIWKPWTWYRIRGDRWFKDIK